MKFFSIIFFLITFGLCESKSRLSPVKVSMKKSPLVAANSNLNNWEEKAPVAAAVKPFEIPKGLKLMIGAGGIYGAFLYYGALQEDVFHYKALDGSKFKSAWLLQALEAFANILFGAVGLFVTGRTKGLPLEMFALSGASQVSAKAFTSLALANGVSFPVVTLAKSGKAVPVMLGSLLLGGASYSLREYASVLAIILGTCIVSMGKKSSGENSKPLGIAFIALSLLCDGLTGGLQDRIKKKSKAMGVSAKPYDMMFWTNLFMSLTALSISAFTDFAPGIKFLKQNPVILEKILRFAVCSAIGQSFIFYTISEFSPLLCTTVTTTRKVFSVILSIFMNGHEMSPTGWAGIGTASLGILSELTDSKKAHGHGHASATPANAANATSTTAGTTSGSPVKVEVKKTK